MESFLAFFRALLYLPEGASTFADGVDALHVFVIVVTMLVAAYVLVSAAWFAARYRRRREGQLTEALRSSRLHEGTLIGTVTGTFLLWWVIGYAQYANMTAPPPEARTVYVEAKQWMWKFVYEDGRATHDVLVVQEGQPVRLVMSSRDVIHSFYVPAFRLKQDVVPGRYVTTWFDARTPGTYPIWCAEYCGVSHSRMRGEVVVLAPEAYAAWKRGEVAGVPAARIDCGDGPGTCGGADLASLGREVATRRACVACHTLDGQKHVGPSWRGLFGSTRRLADGRTVVADEAYLTRSMMEPLADVVEGYPSVMPSYQGQLSAAEAAGLVELIKSLKDATGPRAVDLPALDVHAARDEDGARDGGTPEGGTAP